LENVSPMVAFQGQAALHIPEHNRIKSFSEYKSGLNIVVTYRFNMPSMVVVGGFYGDEGKGKIISYLGYKENFSVAVRGGVGPNAGHTFTFRNMTYKVRMLPSAVLNPATKLLIGAGVLISTETFLNEIATFKASGRTFIDHNSGVIENKHIEKDTSDSHLIRRIGTTGTGTGPANADRALRVIKLAKDMSDLASYTTDVSECINAALDNHEKVLIEGTQGTFLSLYHGHYPYVTSKDVTASAICSDVGIGPKKVDEVLLVLKAYVTRVGEGPLLNEISNEDAKQRGWIEFGSVTGRQRRAAPFDIDLAKRAITLNSATQLAITKFDVVFPDTAGITNFAMLPDGPKRFVQDMEDNTGVKVTLIGTGPGLDDVIDRR
jgi:adenylosuccinate synthase